MRSLVLRAISGIVVGSALLTIPGSASAAPTGSGSAAPTGSGSVAPAGAGRVASGGSGSADVWVAGRERTARDLNFRLSVPGATVRGVYGTSKSTTVMRRGVKGKSDPTLGVDLAVSGRTRCGVLQMTTNGPADGIEWYTFAVLCKPGTATVRTVATRLPWSLGTLPSVRLCNGLGPALAEGDECDTYEPPRGS